MAYANIVFETFEDGIAVLTVNRPQKLNALNAATVSEIEDALGKAEADRSVRGLIVTGAGDKAFVAGADIQELAVCDAVAARDTALRGQRILRRLETMKKPSVAAINGYALGGGLELAMCCTLRVASTNARLGQPEVKLGIVPGYGGTQRLPRLVGRARGLEMLLTGEPVDAARAEVIGLVNHVVPPEELMPFCRELLRKILACGPVAVALAMEAVDAGLDGGVQEGLRLEAAAFGLTAATEDRAEGTRAFLEKRPPVLEGNLNSKGLKFALLITRFNSLITDRLLAGALDALARTGCDAKDIELIKVPGSWELPVAAQAVARQKRHDAIICLSAVIRGDTPHFDYIASEAAKGLAQTAMEHSVPVAFGVLTCDTLEQALDRAGAKGGNKGFDAAMSAVEMGNLLRALRGSS